MAGGGRQDVQRQGDHLQDDEQRDEVAAGPEEHHAAQREQGQGEDLGRGPPGQEGLCLLRAAGPVGGLGREGPVADGGAVGHHHDGQQPDEQEDALGGDGEGILGQARGHTGARQEALGELELGQSRGGGPGGLDLAPAQEQEGPGGQDGQEAQRGLDGQAGGTGDEGLHEDTQDTGAQDDEDRRQGVPVDDRGSG